MFDALDAVGSDYRDRAKRVRRLACAWGGCSVASMLAGMICILTLMSPDPKVTPPPWTFVLMGAGFTSTIICAGVCSHLIIKIKEAHTFDISAKALEIEQGIGLEIQVEATVRGRFLKFSTPGQPKLYQLV